MTTLQGRRAADAAEPRPELRLVLSDRGVRHHRYHRREPGAVDQPRPHARHRRHHDREPRRLARRCELPDHIHGRRSMPPSGHLCEPGESPTAPPTGSPTSAVGHRRSVPALEMALRRYRRTPTSPSPACSPCPPATPTSYLGFHDPTFTPWLIASKTFGRVSPHLNLGYSFRSSQDVSQAQWIAGADVRTFTLADAGGRLPRLSRPPERHQRRRDPIGGGLQDQPVRAVGGGRHVSVPGQPRRPARRRDLHRANGIHVLKKHREVAWAPSVGEEPVASSPPRTAPGRRGLLGVNGLAVFNLAPFRSPRVGAPAFGLRIEGPCTRRGCLSRRKVAGRGRGERTAVPSPPGLC